MFWQDFFKVSRGFCICMTKHMDMEEERQSLDRDKTFNALCLPQKNAMSMYVRIDFLSAEELFKFSLHLSLISPANGRLCDLKHTTTVYKHRRNRRRPLLQMGP